MKSCTATLCRGRSYRLFNRDWAAFRSSSIVIILGVIDQASLDFSAIVDQQVRKKANLPDADLASLKNASSTPSLTFAEVSLKNIMLSSSASARPSSDVTVLLSVQSDLLPMRILLTPSEACCSILLFHPRMSIRVNEINQLLCG